MKAHCNFCSWEGSTEDVYKSYNNKDVEISLCPECLAIIPNVKKTYKKENIFEKLSNILKPTK